jgi:hypothetical protein
MAGYHCHAPTGLAALMAPVGAGLMEPVGTGLMAPIGVGLMVPVGTPRPCKGRGRGGVLTALNVLSNLRFFKPLGRY